MYKHDDIFIDVINIFVFKYFILMICILGLIACSAVNTQELSDKEQRIISLNQQIMCPVCPGESIDQSQNELAVHMKNIIVKLIDQNKSDQEIKNYFVERYGKVILLQPPYSGFYLIVWVVPIIAFIIAFIILCVVLYKMINKRGMKSSSINLSQHEQEKYYSLIKNVTDEQP
jgi:cytochrome c-type biogenesis protein CcmH/NrfF